MKRKISSVTDLGTLIYDVRVNKNLTQENLAKKAGVSRSWLIGIEQGKRPRAELDKLFNLFQALQIFPVFTIDEECSDNFESTSSFSVTPQIINEDFSFLQKTSGVSEALDALKSQR